MSVEHWRYRRVETIVVRGCWHCRKVETIVISRALALSKSGNYRKMRALALSKSGNYRKTRALALSKSGSSIVRHGRGRHDLTISSSQLPNFPPTRASRKFKHRAEISLYMCKYIYIHVVRAMRVRHAMHA